MHGGELKKRKAGDLGEDELPPLPEPALPALDEPYGILVTGVGGTGVVTIGALLGMAAHLEGKGCTVLDMTGLAQKGGAVYSHVRIARQPDEIHAVRIAAGGARLLLGCDLVVSASADALSKLQPGTAAPSSTATRRSPAISPATRTCRFRAATCSAASPRRPAQENAEFLDATGLATGLLGDSIASNLFMLGYAYQRGLVPLSAEAIERAIELNGVAVEFNRDAFRWGRRAAVDPALGRGSRDAAAPRAGEPPPVGDPRQMIERRVAFLTDTRTPPMPRAMPPESAACARPRLRASPARPALTEAVARALFKLMAYKDEYEVARLYTETDFLQRVADQFEGPYELHFHLAPPLLGRSRPRDRASAQAEFRSVDARPPSACWRGCAGCAAPPFDIFGRSAERRAERRLIGEYEALIDEILAAPVAGQPCQPPSSWRACRSRSAASAMSRRQISRRVKAKEAELLARFRAPPPPALAAAE